MGAHLKTNDYLDIQFCLLLVLHVTLEACGLERDLAFPEYVVIVPVFECCVLLLGTAIICLLSVFWAF